jgi:hypothetical protein
MRQDGWWVEKLDFRPVKEWSFGDLKLAYVALLQMTLSFVELIGGGTPIPERPLY